MSIQGAVSLESFNSFGELLRFLRRHAGLTQRELSIAVGYSEGQICRLEQNQRLPDLATISARFAEALDVQDQPATVARLLELGAALGRIGSDRPSPTDPRVHNLPLSLTSFVGREKELAHVKQMLATGRLVTLTGPGGVGKTRLALEVATATLGDFPDGVWLLELASLSDPKLIQQSLENLIDLREEPGWRTLAEYLQPRTVMLIFDNCEHVVVACAQLIQQLLQTCSSLKIMATSREGLGLSGEYFFPVPSLALPDPNQPAAVDGLAQFEAVRLFAERVAAVLPGFLIDQDNGPAIAQICRRLDGIPLAIELAAARVQVLSVQQIAARLDNRFRLLTGGNRAAVPRHQTLSALIGWSYELLSVAERDLLRRLSVFTGSWTLEAAEQIWAEADEDRAPINGSSVGLSQPDLLDLLAQLVNKSLISAERSLSADVRYRMLDTIRQYASERLFETGEGESIRDRHLAYYAAWSERLAPELRGRRQLEGFEAIEVDHDNLRAALDWALSTGPGNAERGLRLAVALSWFWYVRGYWGEGRDWLERALASGVTDQPIKAQAMGELMILAWCQDNLALASAQAAAGQALSRAIGDRPGLALALANEAEIVFWMDDDFERAEALWQESLSLYQSLGPAGRWGCARALCIAGEGSFFRADYPRAVVYLEEALSLFQELGERYGINRSLCALGAIAVRQHDWERARQLLEQSLQVARELRNKAGIIRALNRLAGYRQAAQRRGEPIEAVTLLKESLALSRDLAQRWGVLMSLWGLADATMAQGRPEHTARLLGAVEGERERLGYPMSTEQRADFARGLESCRTAMGVRAFDTAWTDGYEMTIEQATTYGLGV